MQITFNRVTGLVIFLTMHFQIGAAICAVPTPAEIPSLIQRTLDKYSTHAEIPIGVTLQAPTARKNLDTMPCPDLTSGSRSLAHTDADTKAVYGFLVQNAPAASTIFELIPDEFMWWIRKSKHVSFTSLSTALHESSHAMTRIGIRCNDNQQGFFFRGVRYPVDSAIKKTPNYSIAARALPQKFKSTNPMSRYHRYLVMSQSVSGNDLMVLLDEFGAHIEGAELELQLARTVHYTNLQNSGLTALSSNVAGTVEFMQFTVAYLIALKEEDAPSFKAIKNSRLLQQHLQRLWSSAESVVCRSKDFSTQAGGLFQIPPEALRLVSSNWARPTLDELRIRYVNSDECLSFFWKVAA